VIIAAVTTVGVMTISATRCLITPSFLPLDCELVPVLLTPQVNSSSTASAEVAP
jgi:hypothetical protein